jgi:hypothetical protein
VSCADLGAENVATVVEYDFHLDGVFCVPSRLDGRMLALDDQLEGHALGG